jgi:hypothetical protein
MTALINRCDYPGTTIVRTGATEAMRLASTPESPLLGRTPRSSCSTLTFG